MHRMSLIRILTFNCREASALASNGEDSTLPRREGVALRLHQLICRSCRRFRRHLKQLRSGVIALRQTEEIGIPSGAADRIKKALQEQSMGAAGEAAQDEFTQHDK